MTAFDTFAASVHAGRSKWFLIHGCCFLIGMQFMENSLKITNMKLYAYQGCSTCRNAVKWLRAHDIAFTEIPIRETPPSMAELRVMLKAHDGQLRLLFNTSGLDYRALGLKDKLPGMSTDEALQLLTENGNLVKRPFAVDAKRGVHLVGFREDEWVKALT